MFCSVVRFNPRCFGAPPWPAILPEDALNIDDYLPLGQSLRFASLISLIQDVVTGSDSQEAVGKTVGIISMAAPYGGGRFLSLFRNKIDTLTVEYRDANGAFHGAIFTMPVGTAEEIKKELIAQGAHTLSSTSADKEQKQ